MNGTDKPVERLGFIAGLIGYIFGSNSVLCTDGLSIKFISKESLIKLRPSDQTNTTPLNLNTEEDWERFYASIKNASTVTTLKHPEKQEANTQIPMYTKANTNQLLQMLPYAEKKYATVAATLDQFDENFLDTMFSKDKDASGQALTLLEQSVLTCCLEMTPSMVCPTFAEDIKTFKPADANTQQRVQNVIEKMNDVKEKMRKIHQFALRDLASLDKQLNEKNSNAIYVNKIKGIKKEIENSFPEFK